LFTRLAFTQDDEETLVEYPDSSYGIDLGEGYEVLPDGDFIGGPGERGEYIDTDYGPTTQRGLEVFPAFQWRSERRPGVSREAPAVAGPYIYYEATTTPAEITEQKPLKEKKEDAEEEYIGTGVSAPVKYKKPEPEVTD
jgi:hypothetical protein